MILACGTCTHWILWTAFPAATPWAVLCTVWFLVLSGVATASGVKLTAVPRFPIAFALALGSLVLAVAIAGPLTGLWFAPACLLGSASAARLASRPRARLLLLSLSAAAIAALGVLGIVSTAAKRHLSPAERVLLLESTPAWPIELRRVDRGDCATLESVASEAGTGPLAKAVAKRMTDECPSVSDGRKLGTSL